MQPSAISYRTGRARGSETGLDSFSAWGLKTTLYFSSVVQDAGSVDLFDVAGGVLGTIGEGLGDDMVQIVCYA
jgi:hypothetical protein